MNMIISISTTNNDNIFFKNDQWHILQVPTVWWISKNQLQKIELKESENTRLSSSSFFYWLADWKLLIKSFDLFIVNKNYHF